MNKSNRIVNIILILALALNITGLDIGRISVQSSFAAPGDIPHYFGPIANWAFSPALRKFVDSLPGLGSGNVNNLGQYIPIANPDTVTYPDADYYEIGLVEYREQMHSDLPAVVGAKTDPLASGGTKLRGYVQLNNGTDAQGNNTIVPDPVHYLGPQIIARKDRPVRVKFTNMLPTGSGGDLFIPVDPTVMGAGMGPDGMTNYTQNRAIIHLHGGNTPWISDGTTHQWITPANENTPYPKGASSQNVPDMPDPGDGSMTFFYTNQQSARLMFYHDHAFGITRLNVYAGEVAGYLVTDPTEEGLIDSGVLPDQGTPAGVYRYGIPLIIQDKTFVDAETIGITDPLWYWGSIPGTAVTGDLWYPHVYMPAQNAGDPSGMNAFGRWHYAAWFWPPAKDLVHGPVANPYYSPATAPWEPPLNPGVPHPSMAVEAFMDTMMVNGTAFPYLPVERKAYRFRVLNGCDDRFLNLQLYYADPANPTEVKMVPAVANPAYPVDWPTDGRVGGVPDPALMGPDFIQIGTEGGFLPQVAIVPTQPIDWNLDPTTFNFGNVSSHALLLGPAERADIIIDFSQVPAGVTDIILYNDAPAAFPALDARYDYYTGNPDLTDTGGNIPTQAGYGPNIRTVMQFRISGAAAPAYDVAALQAALPTAYAASQKPVIIPQTYYPAPYTAATDTHSLIGDNSLTFTPALNALGMITLTSGGSGYTSVPDVAITGGGGTGATAKASITNVVEAITVTNGGSGYDVAPLVTITGGGGTGATATAVLTADVVTSITIDNAGSGYTSAPVVSFTTVGNGSGAAATASITGQVDEVWLTNGGTGYTTVPSVAISGGGGAGATATASLTATIGMEPKAIQDEMGEAYDKDYGRMSGKLGLERPQTQAGIQNFFLFGFTDPVTEILKDGEVQIWKITHNGVDTHPIHFHLFEVQLINRVAWDNSIRPPEANEMGWKETVRVNPLEDTIVAMRPAAQILPFNVPDSVRPLNPTMPLGSTVGFANVDPITGDPIVVTNEMTNFGHEYTWHCHILGHEEMDMMRPVSFLGSSLPAAPYFVTAEPGDTNAVVSFTPAPVNSSSLPVTQFTVTSSPGGITATGATSPITITDLANGTEYTFTVTATNSLGTGPASEPSDPVVPAVGLSVPGAPTIGIATAGNTQATVTFTAPAPNGGNPITSYTVTSDPEGITATGATSPITVTGLTNGMAYTFTVTATNVTGTGPASAPSNSVTPAVVSAPGAPTIGTATAGNSLAVISFIAPAADGGSPITSYTVTSTPGAITATGATSPITVTGLTNGTAYTFTVTATSALGTSVSSDASNSVTPATVPGAPTTLSAVSGNTQAIVSFTAPASDGGSPITSYTVISSPGAITATGAASPITVTGLTNGTAYTFIVKATNVLGIGPSSSPSNSVTPAVLPDAPIIGTAVAGDSQAIVGFTAPVSNGGSPITSYTVTSNPGGITASGTVSPIMITGLTNGTAYTFTVTATNALGTSLPSAASNSITPATTPAAPTIGTATGGIAQATVSFTAPVSDGGSPILAYMATSNPGGIVASSLSSPITITGLTGGVGYTFTVAAVNALGAGAASAASNSVIPAIPPLAPAIGTVTPASGNAPANQATAFTATYTDANGWQDIESANFLVHTTISGLNSASVYYDRPSNLLYIRNDANSAWIGGYAPGSANTISNSAVTLNCATTTVSGTGNTLTISWNLTFKPAFAGAKNTYLYVRDMGGLRNLWTQAGTWTIN